MTAAAFTTAGHTAGRPVSVLALVRPFLLLGVLAFLAGFGGYLILGPPNVMSLGAPADAAATAPQAQAQSPAAATDASAPATSDEWNAPKHV